MYYNSAFVSKKRKQNKKINNIYDMNYNDNPVCNFKN